MTASDDQELRKLALDRVKKWIICRLVSTFTDWPII